MFEAILFDFDGVLADTEPLHWRCWSEVLRQFQIDLDWKTYCEHCVGMADRAMIEFLCRLSPVAVDFDEVWAQYPAKKQRFQDTVRQHPPIAAATVEILKTLDRYRLAVVTSSGRLEVEPVLVSAGIRELFGVLICGEDVQKHKPAPEPYLKAAEKLGVRSALVVEDSDAGIESARRAGFEVLRISTPSVMPRLLAQRLKA